MLDNETLNQMSECIIVNDESNFNLKCSSTQNIVSKTDNETNQHNQPQSPINSSLTLSKKLKEIQGNHTHSSLTTLKELESIEANGLMENKVLPKKTIKKQSVNNVKAYVPESLILPDDCQYKDQIHYLVSIIYWKQLEDRLQWADYVRLKYDYLKENIPNWDKVWKLCQKLNIVERNSHYSQGTQSYGYRLSEEHRGKTHRLTTIASRSIIKRIKAITPKHRSRPIMDYMRTQLGLLTVDQDHFWELFADDPNLNYYAAHLQTIAEGEIRLTEDDFAGRLHSNVSNLFKKCRQVLRFQQEPDTLGEIDIKNSQPLFLGLAAINAGVVDSKYLQVCEKGQLYEHIAQGLGISRQSAKQEMMSLLFSKNGFRSAAKTFFTNEFPQIAKFMADVKETDHVRLARQMQKSERQFIVDTCCNRLKALNLFFVTIHDSILARQVDCPTVLQVMQDEFSKKGINPNLTWSDLGSQTA